jgi:CRISPR-associated endoribonuclease Cas6/Csy4 subtype I-F
LQILKYYTDKKISSHNELTEIIKKLHKEGVEFAVYFNTVNLLRIFFNKKNDLYILKEASKTQMYVNCKRVRALERQTPRQQEKRLEKLKLHLAKKGIEYKEEECNKRTPKYDYYINMFSFSSQHSMRIYVKNTVVFKERQGSFSSYGLGKDGATLPLF